MLEVGRSRRRARDLPPPPPPTPRITACCGVGGYGIERPRSRGGGTLAGVAAARPSSNAPRTWRRGPQSLGRVGAGRVRRHRRRGPGQGALHPRFASDPTSVVCPRARRVERTAERFSQARDYLERRWTWTPQPHVRPRARDDRRGGGNKARAARYFNVAKALVREEKAARAGATAAAEIRKGTWAPAEAAAAARGYAAMVKSQSASYTVRYPGGGEAGAARTAQVGARRREAGGGCSAGQGPRGGTAARRGRAVRSLGEDSRAAARRMGVDGAGGRRAGVERSGRRPRAAASGPARPGPVGSSLDKGRGGLRSAWVRRWTPAAASTWARRTTRTPRT